MKKIIFLIFLLFLPANLFAVEVEDISSRKYVPRVIKEINEASESIYVCLYFIGYYGKEGVVKDVLDALVNAHVRGVNVVVLLDQGNRTNKYTQYAKNERAFAYLQVHGVPVYFDDEKTVTHSKLVVIDSETVIMGSTNWSMQSFNESREASLLIRSKALAKTYLTEINNIPKIQPKVIAQGFAITEPFFNKNIGATLITKQFKTGFDLYLYSLKKLEQGSVLALKKDELLEYVMYHLKGKYKNRVLWTVKEHVLKSLKKYAIIESYKVDYEQGKISIKFPDFKRGSIIVRLSNKYYEYGWHKNLSSRAKFSYLVLLRETRSGALGRMMSFKSVDVLAKKYGVGRKIFIYGFSELQKYNLVERFVNYNVSNPKTNDYIFNDFYSIEEFENKLSKLQTKTDEKVFNISYKTAIKFNEPYDLDVIKSFILACKTYGTKKFQKTAKHVLTKSKLSPYRNPEFLLTMLRKGMEK
ncbi:MAG: hypothetical protein KAI43_07735 [Candidatus Aureabacteria bacterium]|nr:hypothetical protein [Candidatus Auribacterota bacterium]